ncbi:hypothetical protein J2W17_002991 [Pseudomonas lini]|nr:hypothetical protein [Pseudomonas lini]
MVNAGQCRSELARDGLKGTAFIQNDALSLTSIASKLAPATTYSYRRPSSNPTTRPNPAEMATVCHG